MRPILSLLGHTFEVQPALEIPGGIKHPDYAFFRDAASLNANKDKTLNDTLLASSAFAVGDAKYWDRLLDVSLKKGSDRNFVFREFLEDTPERLRVLLVGPSRPWYTPRSEGDAQARKRATKYPSSQGRERA